MSQPATGPTPIEREVLGDSAPVPGTTTIHHFGRSWVVPVKRHFRHLSHMRSQMQSGYGDPDLLVAETFLSDRLFDGLPEGQVAALWALNPTEADLDELAKKISDALGMGDPGN